MYDHRLIGNIIDHATMQKVVEEGITADYFSGSVRDAFTHIRKALGTGRYPTRNEIEQMFGIQMPPTDPGDIHMLCEAVKKQWLARNMAKMLERSTTLLEGKDVEGALEELLGAAKLKTAYSAGGEKPHSYKNDAIERLEQYEKIKASSGIIGISSMWPSINTLGGWGDGILHTIIATSSVGKTWALAIIADDMSKRLSKNDTVLLVSTEMNPVRIGRRVDCVKYRLPLKSLRDGSLDQASEEKWYEEIEKAMTGAVDFADIVTVPRQLARTVDDIVRISKEMAVKAVLIDGGYRLDTSSGGDWNKQVEIVEQLQEAADKSQIPWIVTSQENPVDTKQGKVGKTMYGARYAKEWSISPDVVIRMRQSEDMALLKIMDWDILKWRDGDGPRKTFHTAWDAETMDYSEIANPMSGAPAPQINY